MADVAPLTADEEAQLRATLAGYVKAERIVPFASEHMGIVPIIVVSRETLLAMYDEDDDG